MEDFTLEELLEYKRKISVFDEKLKEVGNTADRFNKQLLELKQLASSIQDCRFQSLIDYMILEKTQKITTSNAVQCMANAQVIDDEQSTDTQGMKYPMVIDGEYKECAKDEEKALPVAVNNVIPQIITLPKLQNEVDLQKRLVNIFEKFGNDSVDGNRLLEFFKNIGGEGQDTLIISAELYKQNDNVQLFRNVDFHYCYYLDLILCDGILTDRQDESWKVSYQNLRSLIIDAPGINLNMFTRGPIESIIFWNDVKQLYSMSEYFSDFKSLTNIWFQHGIEEIGEYVFCYSGIKEVILPDSLKNVGEKAFPKNTTLLLSHKTSICKYDKNRYNREYCDEAEINEKKGIFGLFSK